MREACAFSADDDARPSTRASQGGYARLRSSARGARRLTGNRHATAGERMSHVPGVTEEDDALLGVRPALLDGRKERVGHAADSALWIGRYNNTWSFGTMLARV